jgi:hypothetical protein
MDNHIRKSNQVEWRGNATDVYSDVPFEAQPGQCLVWQVFGVFFRVTFWKNYLLSYSFKFFVMRLFTFHHYMVWDTDSIANPT